MNAARRQRQHDNHTAAGQHSSNDHTLLQVQAAVKAQEEGKNTPGPVNCPVCRPRPPVWDRGLAGKSATRGESAGDK